MSFAGWGGSLTLGYFIAVAALAATAALARVRRSLAVDGNVPRHEKLALLSAGPFVVAAIFPVVPVPLLGTMLVALTRRGEWSLVNIRSLRVVLATTAIAGFSVLAIVVWWNSRAGIFFGSFLPSWIPNEGWILLLFCVVLAVINSVFEEVLWRRLLFDVAGMFLRPIPAALLLSVLFGLAHLAAVPDGVVGVVLTTCFSLASFALIRLSGGSLLPSVFAHTVAETVVLLLLARVL